MLNKFTRENCTSWALMYQILLIVKKLYLTTLTMNCRRERNSSCLLGLTFLYLILNLPILNSFYHLSCYSIAYVTWIFYQSLKTSKVNCIILHRKHLWNYEVDGFLFLRRRIMISLNNYLWIPVWSLPNLTRVKEQ